MKRNSTVYVILAILFALFNVLAFVIPSEKTNLFWVAYGFTVVMFGVECAVLRMTFGKADGLPKLFLSWPILCVSVIYFFLQTGLFLLFKLCPGIQCWVAVVLCSVVLGAALVCIVATKVGTKLISNMDKPHKR